MTESDVGPWSHAGMSDYPAIDPEAFAARLAALDMAAAERAHAKFMAAEETKDVTELGRNYQRMARSLRQTLGAYARFRREAAVQEAAEARAASRPAWRLPEHLMAPPPVDDADQQDEVDALDAAVQVRIRAEYDPSEAEALDDEIDEAFAALVNHDFLARPLAEQVEAVMARLRPAARAATARPAPEPDPAPVPDPRADDTEPEPEPEPVAEATAEPDAGSAEACADDPPAASAPPPHPEPHPPPEPWPEPYVPPWEKLRPGQIMPGGTGW